MAKSIRSKWRRKMRAEKRKKNAPKEMARLKAILGTDASGDTRMDEVKDVVTMVPMQKLKRAATTTTSTTTSTTKADVEMKGDNAEENESMDLDDKKNKSYLNEHGQYPKWMNPRQCKRIREKRLRKKGKCKGIASKHSKGLEW
ncbi:protein LLP homolog [Lethenteron reissneri]|uniref:protein LLP homolog n=1 Tax=Lethenteron reissneri TaxID=7753 RepID=UPI002AB6D883|nr:protein LLP homolog [Lethenteron reissneri]